MYSPGLDNKRAVWLVPTERSGWKIRMGSTRYLAVVDDGRLVSIGWPWLDGVPDEYRHRNGALLSRPDEGSMRSSLVAWTVEPSPTWWRVGPVRRIEALRKSSWTLLGTTFAANQCLWSPSLGEPLEPRYSPWSIGTSSCGAGRQSRPAVAALISPRVPARVDAEPSSLRRAPESNEARSRDRTRPVGGNTPAGRSRSGIVPRDVRARGTRTRRIPGERSRERTTACVGTQAPDGRPRREHGGLGVVREVSGSRAVDARHARRGRSRPCRRAA
jgi:hypothetical protein